MRPLTPPRRCSSTGSEHCSVYRADKNYADPELARFPIGNSDDALRSWADVLGRLHAAQYTRSEYADIYDAVRDAMVGHFGIAPEGRKKKKGEPSDKGLDDYGDFEDMPDEGEEPDSEDDDPDEQDDWDPIAVQTPWPVSQVMP